MSDNIFNKVQIQTLRFGPISQCNYLVKYTSDHFLLELTDHGIFATFKDANVAEEVFTYCRIDRGDRIHFWDCKLKRKRHSDQQSLTGDSSKNAPQTVRYCTQKSGRCSSDRRAIRDEIDAFIKHVTTDMIYEGGAEYTLKVQHDDVYAIFCSRRLASHLRKTFPHKFTNHLFKSYGGSLTVLKTKQLKNDVVVKKEEANAWTDVENNNDGTFI